MATASNEYLRFIADILGELATELDLHYEEEDFLALQPSVAKIKEGVRLLTEANHPVPDAVTHVIRKFHRSFN